MMTNNNNPQNDDWMRVNIPSWVDALHFIDTKNRELNPLEQFVYDNEPCGIIASNEFRDQLKKLIAWIEANKTKDK